MNLFIQKVVNQLIFNDISIQLIPQNIQTHKCGYVNDTFDTVFERLYACMLYAKRKVFRINRTRLYLCM